MAAGEAIVLVGEAGFAAACFLPFYGFRPPETRQPTLSLYRQTIGLTQGLGYEVGGYTLLFAGVAIIECVAIVRLQSRPPTWSFPALAAAVAVWSLVWLPILLRSTAIGSTLEAGYWCLLVSAGVVDVGTIVVFMAARPNGVPSSPAS